MEKVVQKLILISFCATLMSLNMACATFNVKIKGKSGGKERVELAGETLRCSARSSKSAIFLSVFSVVTAGAAVSALGNLAYARSPLASNPMTFVTAGAAGASLGASIAAIVQQWNAAAYKERSGEILAGRSKMGCRLPEEEPARPRRNRWEKL